MTALIDVNASFDAERSNQLAAQQDRARTFEQRVKDGKMVNLGNGRWQVRDADSWDNGEIFQLSVNGQLEPVHGLYTQDGEVSLYSAHPEWHELGNVIPGGTSDIEQVLELGGVNFRVEQRDLFYQAGGERRKVPGKKVNVRSDTFEPLGVVGGVYTPLQPRNSFEFLQDITSNYGLTWESAGLTANNKLFVATKVPEDIEIDLAGAKDYVQLHLVTTDAWDGNHKFTTMVTPWRPRCANTERFATRDAVVKWGVRHTTNAKDRIEEARRHLSLTLKYAEAFKKEEEQLARIDLEIDGFRELVDSIWDEKKPRDEQTTRTRLTNERRDDCLEGMWAAQVRETGSTAYSAERVVTDYLDHVAPRRAVGDKLAAARATAILEGADDDKKTQAHQKLLLRVR